MERFRRILGAVALSLIALPLVSGCVTQEPPGNSVVRDVQTDFETNDYFNP